MSDDSLHPQVTLFARVDSSLNPYILLYKRAVENQGVTVAWEREFGLRWLLVKGRSSHIVHLHWLESAYLPSHREVRSRLWRRVRNSRVGVTCLSLLSFLDFLTTLVLTKLTGKWVVYTANDFDSHCDLSCPLTFFRRCAQRATFRLAHRVHVHSEGAGEALQLACRRRSKVRVVPVGNYIGSYANRISREEARCTLGLPADAAVFLFFFGLLRPYKGVAELVHAFKELKLPARLMVVGKSYDTEYAAYLSGLCRDDPRVALTPHFVPDDDVQLYMKACDSVVLPYRSAPSSAAVMLALSFGRPVVAPRLAYFDEPVTPDVGVLYDPTEREALKSALRETCARQWSEADILAHARRFDWEVLAPRLVRELYPGTDRP